MNTPFLDTDLFNNHFHSDTIDRNGGGGIGFNYFFLRYIGIGVDGDFDSNVAGIANYAGKLILGLPIESAGCCFAPYVFGGGGESTLDDNDNGFFAGPRGLHHFVGQYTSVGAWMAGAGLEWRVSPMIP